MLILLAHCCLAAGPGYEGQCTVLVMFSDSLQQHFFLGLVERLKADRAFWCFGFFLFPPDISSVVVVRRLAASERVRLIGSCFIGAFRLSA